MPNFGVDSRVSSSKNNMSITLHSCPSSAEAVYRSAVALALRLETSLKANKPILLLLSGGSALKILDAIVALPEFESAKELLSPRLTVGMLDERFDRDPKVNNFSQFMQSGLYKECESAKTPFIDTRVMTDESQVDYAARWNLIVTKWIQNNPDGEIVITQGIGPDGHTSGILPFPENPQLFEKLFNSSDRHIAGYDGAGKNQYPLRVTATFPLLKKVSHSILFACGGDKITALTNALDIHSDKSFAEVPARIIQEMKEVQMFTDADVSF